MYDCYSVEFEVIVHHKEIGEFEADVVISVNNCCLRCAVFR